MNVGEDPTLPLTRTDIERLRRRSAPHVAAAKLVAQGPVRPLQVSAELAFFESLEAFAHIGFAGTPANMLTSGLGPMISGEIEVSRPSLAELALVLGLPPPPPPPEHWPEPIEPTFGAVDAIRPRTPESANPMPRANALSGPWLAAGQHASDVSGAWPQPPLVASGPVQSVQESPVREVEAKDDLDSPARRRWPWVVVLVGAAAATIGSIAIFAEPSLALPEPQIAVITPPEPKVILSEPPVPESIDFPVHPDKLPTVSEEGPVVIFEPPRKKDSPKSAACRATRDQAAAAFLAGQWANVESLTRRKVCWKRPRDFTPIRLRALFELGQFDECIKLGKGDKSPAGAKWKTTCENAKS